MPSSCWLSFGAPPDLSSIRAHYAHSHHLGRRCGAIPDGARAMQPQTKSSLVSCCYRQPGCTKMMTVTGKSSGSRQHFAMAGAYLDECAGSRSVARFTFAPRCSAGGSCMSTGPFSACACYVCNGTGRWAIFLPLLPFRPSGLQTKLYSGRAVVWTR